MVGEDPGASAGRRRRPFPRGWLVFVTLGLAAIITAWLAAGGAAPAQPIRFSHQLHVKEAKCAACHVYIPRLAAAGTPRLADCLDCHEGTQSKTPEGLREEAKIDEYAKAKREIPWVRISNMLPPHVFFSHRRHVALAKLDCASCHGAIAQTNALPTRPAVAFTMDWCLSCHRKRAASTDCIACHR